MKNFFVLISEILTLYVSNTNVTTVHFDERVRYCDVALNKSDFSLTKRREDRSVTLFVREKIQKPTSMICYLQSGDLKQFRLTFSGNEDHTSVRAGNAGNELTGKLVYKSKSYSILEAERNFIIKTKKKLKVNGKEVNGDSIVSKWLPIRINGKEVKF